MDIIDEVRSVYDRGELSYPLFNYVDRNFWNSKISEYFPSKYIDNLTDYNYGKCHTLNINLSNINSGLGTKRFHNYIIENKELYVMTIEISVLAPYCRLGYSRYCVNDYKVEIQSSQMPYREEDKEVDEKIKDFISKYKLTRLDEETLKREITEKSLELTTEHVNVYNCLFDD